MCRYHLMSHNSPRKVMKTFPQTVVVNNLYNTNANVNTLLAPTPVLSFPASTYILKVGFDTFENPVAKPVASMFSFTLQVKIEGYRRTRHTRVFLCASSPNESSREALDWCLEYLVQEGDELVFKRCR